MPGTTHISSLSTVTASEADAFAPEPNDDDVDLTGEESADLAQNAENVRRQAVEAEARRGGWKPLEEFGGAPGTWRTAEEFLARGNDILPIVRKKLDASEQSNKRMEAEARALRETLREQSDRLQRVLDREATAEQRGYERAKRELLKQQRDAAASGDVATYDAVAEQITALDEEAALNRSPPRAAPPPAAPAVRQPAEDPVPDAKVAAPEIEQFVAENPWFLSDRLLNEAMQSEHKLINMEEPGLALADNLKKAKARVMRRFPAKFGIDPGRRPRPPVSQPTGGDRQSSGAATGIASIADPAERADVKAAFIRARNLMPDLTEAEYMSAYSNPNADVLELQREAAAKRRK